MSLIHIIRSKLNSISFINILNTIFTITVVNLLVPEIYARKEFRSIVIILTILEPVIIKF